MASGAGTVDVRKESVQTPVSVRKELVQSALVDMLLAQTASVQMAVRRY